MSIGLPQSSLCESERERVHDGKGNMLSVGKGKRGSTIIFMVLLGSVRRTVLCHS